MPQTANQMQGFCKSLASGAAVSSGAAQKAPESDTSDVDSESHAR